MTSLISITFMSKLYCSAGSIIWKNKHNYYRHLEESEYKSIMIGRSIFNYVCTEILQHVFRSVTQVTDVFVNAPEIGLNSAITISYLEHKHDCQHVKESIILYEFHHKLDIVYRYTYVNTATSTVMWHSVLKSDLYVHITKKLMQPGQKCFGVFKSITVRYFKDKLSDASNIRDFKYHNAR